MSTVDVRIDESAIEAAAKAEIATVFERIGNRIADEARASMRPQTKTEKINQFGESYTVWERLRWVSRLGSGRGQLHATLMRP